MKAYFGALLHRLAHALGWNEGRIESWSEGGRWMMGFRCDGCGELFHAFEMDRATCLPKGKSSGKGMKGC